MSFWGVGNVLFLHMVVIKQVVYNHLLCIYILKYIIYLKLYFKMHLLCIYILKKKKAISSAQITELYAEALAVEQKTRANTRIIHAESKCSYLKQRQSSTNLVLLLVFGVETQSLHIPYEQTLRAQDDKCSTPTNQKVHIILTPPHHCSPFTMHSQSLAHSQ